MLLHTRIPIMICCYILGFLSWYAGVEYGDVMRCWYGMIIPPYSDHVCSSPAYQGGRGEGDLAQFWSHSPSPPPPSSHPLSPSLPSLLPTPFPFTPPPPTPMITNFALSYLPSQNNNRKNYSWKETTENCIYKKLKKGVHLTYNKHDYKIVATGTTSKAAPPTFAARRTWHENFDLCSTQDEIFWSSYSLLRKSSSSKF